MAQLPFTLVFLLLLSFHSSATTTITQHGVIGYGITMYNPTCCYACSNSLSSLYLNCTTFSEHAMDDGMMSMKPKLLKRMDMGGESMATTSDECYATDKVWLETFAYCVKSRCSGDGVEDSRQSMCFSKLAANGLPVPALEECLPHREPVSELAEDAEWLNQTSLVNGDLWDSYRRTLAEFESSEDRHTRYSLVVWLFVVGLCAAVGLSRIVLTYLPVSALFNSVIYKKVQQHLVLPALYNHRHLDPLPFNIGYLPSRSLSLFITAYIILNILLCSVSYHNATPNAWWSTTRSQMVAYISNRTGVLSFANLALAILCAGRNSLLIALTGWSQTTFLTFHRWASRVATVQAIVHSVIYTLTYFWDGGAKAYYAEAAKAYYWWGIIATVVLAVMLGLSVLPFRLRAYEIFLVTHILLAILALVGCWYHIDIRFHKRWGYEVWLYLAFAFWAFERTARLVRVVAYNWVGGPTTTAHVEVVPDTDFVVLTIFPSQSWKAGPGQHTFLYLPELGRFWESHPFTIADWGHTPVQVSCSSSSSTDGDVSDSKAVTVIEKTVGEDVESQSNPRSPTTSVINGRFFIRCFVRARAGTTLSLHKRLLNHHYSSPSPRSAHLTAYSEGPYGGHRTSLQPLVNADTILCIAGGIGITSSLGFIKHYVDDSALPVGDRRTMKKTSRMVLAWSAREMGLINYAQRHLLPVQEEQNRALEYRLWQTGAEEQKAVGVVSGSRMNVAEVVKSVAEKGRRLVVLVCAPGAMADEVRQAVVICAADGMMVDILEEAFAW